MANLSTFVIQRDRTTVANRYPEVFHPVRRLSAISDKPHRRILSFGCSTGEEPYDLATTYFPDASVIGLDVWPDALVTAKAERSLGDRIIYDISSPETVAKYGPYDIIFAMSVLCRWPDLANVADASQMFPFSHFVEMVTLLDSHLTLGGLLVIYNANYDFKDTDLISRYEIALVPGISTNGFVKHFDRGGMEMPDYCGTDVIYRKSANHISQRGHVLRFVDAVGQPLGRLFIGDHQV